MIELYESKLKFVDNMKESGLFNAIEQRIIKLSKELVSSSLNQKPYSRLPISSIGNST